jgi:hypothetical protein
MGNNREALFQRMNERIFKIKASRLIELMKFLNDRYKCEIYENATDIHYNFVDGEGDTIEDFLFFKNEHQNLINQANKILSPIKPGTGKETISCIT